MSGASKLTVVFTSRSPMTGTQKSTARCASLVMAVTW